jgi:hypothetical protein
LLQARAIPALFDWTYQHNQQLSSSVFLSQQTSEQYFQHNKPAKRTGCPSLPFLVAAEEPTDSCDAERQQEATAEARSNIGGSFRRRREAGVEGA